MQQRLLLTATSAVAVAAAAVASVLWSSANMRAPAASTSAPWASSDSPNPLAPTQNLDDIASRHRELRPLQPAPPSPETPNKPDPKKKGSPLAKELHSQDLSPQHDVDILHALLRQYLRHLKNRPAVPIGNDSDLAKALTGHNPMRLTVLPSDNPALCADGRLRDRWGTPYFLHPQGRNTYEIRSAGPDRKLFSADDLLADPAAPAPDSHPDFSDSPTP